MPNGSLKPELATSDEKNAAIVSPGVGSHSPSTVSTRGDMVPYSEAKALSQTLPAIFPSFFSAMERTQDVVMITSAEGIDEPGGPKLVYVNPAFEKLTGYSFEEAVGRSALFLQGPNTDAHARARLRAALESGQPAREELINYRKDGSEFWVELSIDPIEDENGVCTHWVSVQRDTTQRNLLRDRLAAQDRDLVEAQRIAELGTWSWDCQTDTVTWSRQTYKIFDIDPAETAPDYEAVQARYSPASRVVHDAAVRRCVKDGTPYELDLQIVDLDGATRWILARGEVESYRDGKPSRLRGTVQDITGRKHLEEEVRQSRDKLAWVLSTITDGLLMIDRDWRYTYVNEQAGQVLGVNPDNLLGQRVWDIFPAARQTEFWRGYNRAVETGTPVHFEEFYPEPLNLWLECHCYPSGAGLSVYFRDVSERKKMAEEVRLANERFELALSGTPIALFHQNLDLRYTWVYNQCFGPVDVVGKNDHDLFPEPGVAEQFIRLKREVIETGRCQRQEVRVPGASGEHFYDLLIEPLRDENGQAAGVRCAAVDISERKKTEAAHEASEELVRLGVRVAALGLAHIDYDTGMNSLSVEAARMYGIAQEAISVPRERVHAVFYKEDRPELERLIANCLDPLGPGWFDMDHRVVWPEGEIHWLRVRKQVYFKGTGTERRPDRAVLAAFDITASKNVEQALLRSEKLASVGRMASTIAHEINNPLEIIGQSLYLALTEEDITESVRPHLELSVQELDRVALITRQTLAFNRESSSPKLTDLAELARSVVQLFRSRLMVRGIAVEERYRGDTGVMAFAGELRQIFSNLVSNSMDAIPRRGTLYVRVHRVKDAKSGAGIVRMIVADTGSGIPEKNLNKIFEPFFTTKEIVGTGLGLWVTNQLVDKHKGTLRVRSRVGTGTVFVASFPAGVENASFPAK